MTDLQQIKQCDGPHRPTAEKLGLAILREIPAHVEVRAISIKGQGGGVFVECLHEGMELTYELKNV